MATKRFPEHRLARLDGTEETLRSENPAVVAGSSLVDPKRLEAVKQVNAMIAKRTNCAKTKEERRPFENGAHPDQ